MSKTFKVVGLGEILWDVLPTGRQLGGAPANFAYIASLLGDEGIAASRLGDDDLGREARTVLAQLGVPSDFIQTDRKNPTGTVKVDLDSRGQASFEFADQVAWDFLEWSPAWKQLAHQADAVCFGSLAQRAEVSRGTITSFVQATPADAVRIFDVNLRQHFFTREVVAGSLRLATIVKVNHEELPRICEMLNLPANDDCTAARSLAQLHQVKLVCVTRGPQGSLLASRTGEVSEHPGFRVRIGDTVGAGDAFTAALVHGYLRGASPERMNEAANRMGAWVASQVGATPIPEQGRLAEVLAKIS